MKQTVEVTILNQQYSMKTEAPVTEVEAVAAYVNEQLAMVMKGSRSVDTLHNVVLALLNVSGGYLKSQDEIELLRKQLESLDGNLTDAVEKIESELEHI